MSATKKAYLAGGCFWGVEDLFRKVPGVIDATSGYMGGHVKNVTYKEVCSGLTGHAEVVEVEYDPSKVSYSELLHIFWEIHDPTTLNRQGPDVGTQYRSAIYYSSTEEQMIAEGSKSWAQQFFNNPIVTEITELETFWPAEDYHQHYFERNGGHGCHLRRSFGRDETGRSLFQADVYKN
ncbi:MAG: peptide-methionine (S)-S-oxide reductase MsrA [Armatimonadetes bacterium]|nr:peptide-methionine (S)-S-oxide reductase MsrA [Armatimonadota bacterium]